MTPAIAGDQESRHFEGRIVLASKSPVEAVAGPREGGSAWHEAQRKLKIATQAGSTA